MAENADPECEFSDLADQIGRIIAIGVTTVFVGMGPSLIISKLHQRDFIDAEPDSPEWCQHLRVWQLQDRVIYVAVTIVILFCMFFDVVFISNVTATDGMSWFSACAWSMFQTIILVPVLMTLFTLSSTILTFWSSRIHKEATCLCLCGSDDEELSRLHKPPLSKWNSAHVRKSHLKKRKEHADAWRSGSKSLNDVLQPDEMTSDSGEGPEAEPGCLQNRMEQLAKHLADVQSKEASLRQEAKLKSEEADRLENELSRLAADLSNRQTFNYCGPVLNI